MQKDMKNNVNKNEIIYIEPGKIQPNAVELEEIVIGSLIIEPDAIFKVESILKPEIFYKESHQKIYKAILEVKKADLIVDLMTVSARLKKDKVLEEIGGNYALSQLMSRIGNTYNIVTHALILHQEYFKRLCINKSYKLSQMCYDESIDIVDIINEITDLSCLIDKEINTVSENNIRESEINLSESLNLDPHLIAIKTESKLVGIMSKKNISLFIGKAKSRKTFAITLFVSHLVGGIQTQLIWCKKSNVIIFDTEQSRFHSQKILKRLSKILGVDNQPENIKLYGIKRYTSDIRRKIIETVIKRDRPDVVIIDGVRDLVLDFNDLRETSEVKDWIMMLADKYDCHISMVLHMNKNDMNPRGHLGSELVNKSETVLQVRKEDDSISIIEPAETRGESFNPIRMRIISGVPEFEGFETLNVVQPKRRSDFQADNPF